MTPSSKAAQMRFFASLTVCLVMSSSIFAAVPQIINYQGRIAVGNDGFSGSGKFKFALVHGTTGATLWSNDGSSVQGSEPAGVVTINVFDGLYSILLGDTSIPNMRAIPYGVFENADVRLRVWFDNGVNGSQQLSPDQRISAVGYAMVAADVPNGAITAEKLAQGAAAENLQASGQSAVPTGGVMLSFSANDTNLINAGYIELGKVELGEAWDLAPLQGDAGGRGLHTAVWTGTEIIVWGGASATSSFRADGWRYNPSTKVRIPTSAVNAPSPRRAHTAVWTGTEMIIWGGIDGSVLGDGARYNPTTDSWTPISNVSAPFGRINHSAIWTGTEMIIWGGSGNIQPPPSSGARYNPETDSWTQVNTVGAPSGRTGHSAVWTGTEMIIWGGFDTMVRNTGARYNPASNLWAQISTTGAPVARRFHTAIWTGVELVVWGGTVPGPPDAPINSGGRYNLVTDSWTPTTNVAAPAARTGHSAIWTGWEMIVWGGSGPSSTDTYGHLSDGARYNPWINIWTTMKPTSAFPGARTDHAAVWTGSAMIVSSGTTSLLSSSFLSDIWVYTPQLPMYLYRRP